MRGRRRMAALTFVLFVLGAGTAYAAFSRITSNPGNSFQTVDDFLGPTASRAVVQKSQGGTAGYLKNGGTFRVYAQVDDQGNPAHAIASVQAVVPNLVAAGSPATMTVGSYTVDGQTYNYGLVANLTARNPLATGTWQLNMSDDRTPANTTLQSGSAVIIDNAACTSFNVQTANAGAFVGRPEINDTITYTFSEPVEPASILAGWTGAATDVTLRLNNNAGQDRVQIWNSANGAQLPLGEVNTLQAFTGANRTFGAPATAQRSRMAMSGSAITVTLGTASGATTTSAGGQNMTWTPVATPYDRAANTCTAVAVNEAAPVDVDF